MSRGAWLFVAVWLTVITGAPLCACARLGRFSDPTVESTVGDLCSVFASENRRAIEAEAKRQAIPLSALEDLFRHVCELRIKDGLRPARFAALAAVRRQLPEDAGDGGTP